MEGYVVFFDKLVRKESKIHQADCPEYLTRKPVTSTTEWSDIYSSIAHAKERSGVTRKAKCCLDS